MGFHWVDKAAQPLNVTNCDREPIRTPGSIMADGFLLVCEPRSGQLIAYSSNARDMCAPEQALPRTVQNLFTVDEFAQLAAWCSAPADTLNLESFRKPIGNKWFDLTAHSNGSEWIIEGILSTAEDEVAAALDAQAVFDSFLSLEKSDTVRSASGVIARAVQDITDYDRVMVYQFDSQWNGAVIAEACGPGVESRFIDTHFPHTDIPVQARQLYRVNKTRCISDIYQATSELVCFGTGEVCFVDLGFAHLRAISPIHIQYLHNMDVTATQTVSIIVDGSLWGLIACHHHQGGKRPSIGRRKQCVVLSSMLGSAITRIESTGTGERGKLLNEFTTRMRSYSVHQGTLTDALGQVSGTLRKLFRADGLRIRFGDEVFESGHQISEKTLMKVHRFCWDGILVHDCLAELVSADGNQAEPEGGLVLIRMDDNCRDYVLLSRTPLKQDVNWAGHPTKKGEDLSRMGALDNELSPRTSFEIWKQRVTNRSMPFERSDADAAMVVKTALLNTLHHVRSSKVETADVQDIDLLTGLPDRRGFLTRLAEMRDLAGEADSIDLFVVDMRDYDRLNFELGMADTDLVMLWFSQALTQLSGIRLVGRVADEKFALAGLGSEVNVEELLGEIRQAAVGPYMVNEEVVYFSAFIGHASLPDPFSGRDPGKALENALEAAYLAARNTTQSYIRHGPTVARHSAEAIRMRDQLRLAVSEQGLDHQYRLICDVKTGRFIGAEALMRWTNPVGEVVPAEKLIDKLKQIDLLEEADYANISRSLRRVSELPEDSDFFVAFNLGGGLADGRRETELDELLQLARRHARNVAFLIHQSDIQAQPHGTLVTARKIVSMGIRLFLGGFGSGESGLGIMAEYPIRGVFLSRELVRDYEKEHMLELLVAQNQVASALKVQIVCTGVENAQQAGILARKGLDLQQGSLYSDAVLWNKLLSTTTFYSNKR